MYNTFSHVYLPKDEKKKFLAGSSPFERVMLNCINTFTRVLVYKLPITYNDDNNCLKNLLGLYLMPV